ncbi:hypothetical protein CCR97_18940 [Rhodoplanes elegans]|uniref:Helix-turn-helix domain-containing protein n=1 Tax=Rhodoplanes elegans TaxID=29408 RepID=A0A327KP88_9BRAD|nr:helix-turn-helix domain-containing protein [Rhodoplanes elegans]MBK5960261.1 hypothetical protein [Rhodoplanes elegans]RAI40710.1 hypothetical protein CH338_05325 [Rhodoplanes elegans]
MSTSDLLPPAEAAAYTRRSVNTLAGWRSTGAGPTFCKLGGRIYYRRTDLDAWIESCRVTSTAEARALPKPSVKPARGASLQGAA